MDAESAAPEATAAFLVVSLETSISHTTFPSAGKLDPSLRKLNLDFP